MRALTLISVVALCTALAAPASERQGEWAASSVSPGYHAGEPSGLPSRSVSARQDRRPYFGPPPPRPYPPPGRDRPRRWPVPPFYYYHHHHDRDVRERTDIDPPAPQPAPPVTRPQATEVPPAELEPPDPRGPTRFVPARGSAQAEPPYKIGEPLPPGLPYVTLDWAYYGLPEPAPGHIYVRIRRDVLLIEAASARVEGRIDVNPATAPGR